MLLADSCKSTRLLGQFCKQIQCYRNRNPYCVDMLTSYTPTIRSSLHRSLHCSAKTASAALWRIAVKHFVTAQPWWTRGRYWPCDVVKRRTVFAIRMSVHYYYYYYLYPYRRYNSTLITYKQANKINTNTNTKSAVTDKVH